MTAETPGLVDEESLAILRLSFCRGVGNLAVHRLLDQFGCAKAVLDAHRQDLLSTEGISESMAENIMRGPEESEVADELELLDRCSTGLSAFTTASYPEPLKYLGHAAPPLLRIRGRYTPADRLAIALVGSRNCTHYGRVQARRFAMTLAEMGFTIVSGHARGIDEECHRAALQAGGRTLAVLGCGIARLDKLHEPELALEIAEKGALLSELSMNALPLARNFPPRNRLISGLAAGVIVIEAGNRSGSLITARLAGEQGKAVFAVPGSVQSPASRGCHQLIRDGAFLTEDPRQILDEIGPLPSPVQIKDDIDKSGGKGAETVDDTRQIALNERERRVLDVIEHQPRLMDELVEEARLPVSTVSSILMSLEIRGLVTRLEGDRYVRGSGFETLR